ncbi:MAG: sigma-70 family RNA polymerase sigma factor [Aquabacterium sp.]|nr:MAG: sigma-70 family RNA polymerase sigma factor [Aquabacterium sp.]
MADCAPMPPPDPSAPPQQPSDATLLAAYAMGQAQAFEHLYARHQAGLYRFVRRLLGTALAAQADEVFQDVWMRVLQSAAGWQADGAASFRTWLYTLAHHRAVDMLRKSGRELSIDAGSEDAHGFEPEGTAAWAQWPAADGPAAEDQVFWRAAGQRLLDCLDQLPAAQRAAFLLHHEEGLALDQLAAKLELGFETLKSRLRYAMSKLRTCMGAYLPPAP